MNGSAIVRLPDDFKGHFPPANHALSQPNGLLAVGGNLQPDVLLAAYRKGIFPWSSDDEPLLWWSPDPRYGFVPGRVHVGRSRRRILRTQNWRVRADTCFETVIAQCANSTRAGQNGTWITGAMIEAYVELHRQGYGHSIEVFDQRDDLLGGLYGLAIGRVFFAESMFSQQSQGSSAALLALSTVLRRWNWPWIDAQMHNPHLQLLGGQAMPRRDYLALLNREAGQTGKHGAWTAYFDALKWPEILNQTGANAEFLCTNASNLSK
jgi:leucyl/phenylalanyl-tRNA---protein transferase